MLITVLVAVILAFGWSILVRLEQSQAMWSAYNQRIHQINAGLFNIHRQMGYGGFIHHFKDMLLTRDAARYGPLIEQDLAELDGELARLLTVLVLPENRARVEVMRETFRGYEARYRQAAELLRQGHENPDLDPMLAMHDQTALDALQNLIQRAGQLTRDTESRALQAETEVMRDLRTGGLLVLALVLLCGGVMVWQVHRLIGAYAQIKNHETELAHALASAEQASRAKTAFISNMSHELRTPMNSILGFAQLMETDPALPNDQKDSVHEILVAGRHLLRLINEVLDLARIEAGRIDYHLEPVALQPLMQEVRQLMRVQAEQAHVSLDLEADEDAWVQADRQKLMQTLMNLVSNGIKYNRVNGSVKLQVHSLAPDWLRLVVSDTGVGIATEHQPGLFEPFNRAAHTGSHIQGTGIGLSLSKRWIQAMGGRMGVDSAPGQGSAFWLELPSTHADTFIEAGKAI